MKLVSLNVCGGAQGQVLIDFLKDQAKHTDIFCFQEVFNSTTELLEHDGVRLHLFQELKDALPGFNGYFIENFRQWVNRKKVDFDLVEGQAIFVRNHIKVKNIDELYTFGSKQTEIKDDFTNAPMKMQLALLEADAREFTVANAHGMWYPGEKLDTPERLEQSKKIRTAMDNISDPKILCGDFNLMPETESIAMLEQGMVNLIKKFGITNTRNEVSWKLYSNRQSFADFTFTSPQIRVKFFEVPYTLASDHLPMILEFS